MKGVFFRFLAMPENEKTPFNPLWQPLVRRIAKCEAIDLSRNQYSKLKKERYSR